MTLGEKIKWLRDARRWTQQELAQRAGVRQALISELERGRKTDAMGRNLRKLAWALGVSIDYLTGLYDREDAQPHARKT
jgi:transcriptional regulator with XRE-family HTH domain